MSEIVDLPANRGVRNESHALLGPDVVGAGDVSGDGFAGVTIGFYPYDNGQVDEGAAFAYSAPRGVGQ